MYTLCNQHLCAPQLTKMLTNGDPFFFITWNSSVQLLNADNMQWVWQVYSYQVDLYCLYNIWTQFDMFEKCMGFFLAVQSPNYRPLSSVTMVYTTSVKYKFIEKKKTTVLRNKIWQDTRRKLCALCCHAKSEKIQVYSTMLLSPITISMLSIQFTDNIPQGSRSFGNELTPDLRMNGRVHEKKCHLS